MTPEQVTSALITGRTSRYHTHHPVMTQTVADHTWGVVALLIMVCPEPSTALLQRAAFHDAGERFTGDTPYPAKAAAPELRTILQRLEDAVLHKFELPMPALTEQEQCWLKWADMAECAIFTLNLWEECRYPCAREVAHTAVHVLLEKYTGLSEGVDALNAYLHEHLERSKA